MQFEITITGVKNLKQKLGSLKRSLSDWREAFRTIGADYTRFYGSVPFASRGSIYGTPWPPLNPAYKSWKSRAYPGRPILVRTGELMSGFEFLATDKQVKIFNRVPYFEKHQRGIGVPQRIIMALNDERRQAAVEILRADLMRKLKAA